MKILFITLSNIGDVILTLPALDALRANFSDPHITVMVGSRPKELFFDSPAVERVIVYDKHAPLKDKIRLFRELQKEKFDLSSLAQRRVEYGRSFTCQGANDGCDRKCAITNIKLEGKAYPFGGSCNKYYNLRFNLNFDTAKKDLVVRRLGKRGAQAHRNRDEGRAHRRPRGFLRA